MKGSFPIQHHLPTQVFTGWTEVTHNLCFGEQLRFWPLLTAFEPLCVALALVPGAPLLCSLPTEAGQQQQGPPHPISTRARSRRCRRFLSPRPVWQQPCQLGMTRELGVSPSMPNSALVPTCPLRLLPTRVLKHSPGTSVEGAFRTARDPEEDARGLTVS